jgi:two-component system response regulator DevR
LSDGDSRTILMLQIIRRRLARRAGARTLRVMDAPPTRHTNVFLVEDSAPIRARLVELLCNVAGVEIVGEADTPASAIDGILRTHPDTVVLDIRLTGGSGIEVLRRVCPVAPEIVFIMLTNHPDPQYRKICIESGASYFLDKSAEFEKVRDVITSLGAVH